jgi:glycosyltransferase involved in cell wall biosynthesis
MDDTKKKILMIAATPFFSDRGCHIRIYNEIKYLKKNGIDTVLCTYHLGNNIDGFEIKRIRNVSWYKKITPGAAWGKIYLDFLLLILSVKVYFKNKPKIIHAHLYEGLLIALFVKIFSLGRSKIIFDCQGSLAEEMYAYTLQKSFILKPFYYIFLLIEKILLYIPNKILCSSKNSYDFIINKYKISKDKIDILNDGVDEDLFKSYSGNKNEIKNNLGIPLENIVILYTGSISKAKGIEELFNAIPEILHKKNDITFVFAGYGDLEEEFKVKLAEYIQKHNVVFVGRFSYFDLPKYTTVADYAIDPKKDSSESSGKLFNYIAAGLPVICFKNKFNNQVLKDIGIYIKTFSDILNNMSIPDKSVTNVATWNVEIKKLVEIYD